MKAEFWFILLIYIAISLPCCYIVLRGYWEQRFTGNGKKKQGPRM